MAEELRSHIVSEIKRIANANGGQPPGSSLFVTETAIGEHKWRGRYWANWGNALKEAGFEPNQWTKRLDSDSIVRKVARLTIDLGHVPSNSEMNILRRSDSEVPSPKTVGEHFKKAALLRELVALGERDPEFAGLVAIVPTDTASRETKSLPPTDTVGWVYLFSYGTNRYKIGLAKSVERRFVTLDGHSPDAIEIVWKIRTDDPPGVEGYWHKRFADQRIKNEYFLLSKQDVAAFKRWRQIF